MKRTLALCSLLFLAVLWLPAQEMTVPDTSAEQAQAGVLTIQTDVENAVVFLDSAKVGTTPLTIRDVRPGFYRLKVMHPDIGNWLTGSILDSVEIGPVEERVLRYTFGRRYLILSIPSDAEVVIDDSLRGTTPFLLALQEQDSISSISLRKSGYDTTAVNLADATRGVETVTLKKLWRAEPGEEPSEEMGDPEKHNTFPIFVTGVATVLTGAAAAYFKIQADKRNTEYLQNPNPSLRSETQRLDTASALCLTASQVGFGLVAYFLLTE